MRGRGTVAELDLRSYLRLTRSVTVSIAYLLPLLAAYEVGLALTGSDLRNSAEMSIKHLSGWFGGALVWIQRLILCGVAVVAGRLAAKDVPALRLYPVFLLEAALLALLLGPAVSLLVGGLPLRQTASAGLGERVLLSIGAGVYEELAFRFLLLAGTFWLLHRGLALPRGAALAAAVGGSALLFAGYHHAGRFAEPFTWPAFAFRAGAGAFLGLIFAWRGLALCAYLHAFYDIFCDVRAGGGDA